MSDTSVSAHPQALRRTTSASRWLSVGPASRLVGVDPDTLRRWADEGRVQVYVTPGRHRRFDRRTMERLATQGRGEERPLASLGASPGRLARAYRLSYNNRRRDRPPLTDHVGDRERYRQDGRQLVEALVAHLDADPGDERARGLAEARATALIDDLARRLHDSGVSLTEGVGSFVASRRPFLAELAGLGRRRALDAARLGRLYEDATLLLDRLLLRLIETYLKVAG